MVDYEFKCNICGTHQLSKDRERSPVCCGEPTQRVWAIAGFQVKGSGFYAIDVGRTGSDL